jgi:hypothetical protein
MGRVRAAVFADARCSVRGAPRSWFDRPGRNLSRARLVLRGGAGHPCDVRSKSEVARVLVSVARLQSHGHCRFVKLDGRLGALRSCHRPIFHRATGRTRWSLKLKHSLPPGLYQAQSRALNGAGSRERSVRYRTPRNLITFRLR